MKKILTSLLALACITAYAQQATAPLTTTARINASCSITADSIAFGDITPSNSLAEYVTVSGNVNVKCTNQTAYNIFQGWGTNGDLNGRLLKNVSTGATKGYMICSTPGVTAGNCSNNKRWYPADYSGLGYYITGTGTGNIISHPVYVSTTKIYVTPGIYSDSITTTISF